jgi:hypothetical protein
MVKYEKKIESASLALILPHYCRSTSREMHARIFPHHGSKQYLFGGNIREGARGPFQLILQMPEYVPHSHEPEASESRETCFLTRGK